jgi:Cys-tRNA(Pro)/Cys-tRNA(Cys) deacylase
MRYNESMSKRSKHATGGKDEGTNGTAAKGGTPAIAQLRKAGVPFETYEYEHSSDHMDEGYGIEAAQRLGLDPHQIFKTLMADTGSERVIGIVPVSGHLDLKALAAAVGAKKAAMADPDAAQRESGYVLGGISPFGQRTRHRTVLDESALNFDSILVSGGKRGLDVSVNPADLVTLLRAATASIATW